MKNTTQQILTIIQSENFSEIFKLKEKVNSFGWGNQETQEMNFEEAILEIESVLNILINAINDKNNLFENILTFQDRSNVLSTIQTLNTYIANIKDGSNNVPSFIQQIQQLKSFTKKFDLEREIKGYPNYEEKSKQVNYLKQKYEKLIQDLNSAETLKKQSEEILSSISEKDKKAVEYLISVNESNAKITSTEKDRVLGTLASKTR